jgi:hypothetical protein
VRGLIDRDGREIHPHQRNTGLPGQPQPWSAAPAAKIGERLSWRKAQCSRHVTQQGGRDEGERLDLRRQIGRGKFPDPAKSGGRPRRRKALVEVGGARRGHGFSPRGVFLIATSINKIAHRDVMAQQDSWQTAAYDRI